MNITQNIKIGPEEPLLLIAGPCQAESLEHSLTIAEYLQELITRRNFAAKLVFKASYDKANRTSLSGKRGPGIQAGLNILAEVKNKTKLPILTDVHSTEQVTLAAEVADILQLSLIHI